MQHEGDGGRHQARFQPVLRRRAQILRALAWVALGGLVLGLSTARASDSAAAGAPVLSVAEGQALAAKSRCLGCHQVDSRRVGPPFRAVAKRFRGQPEAAPYLARVMRQGSSGQWGAIPMPAQTQLSPGDALTLARWILSLGQR